MKIIGVTGRKRHGKNTVGNILAQAEWGDTLLVGFADKVKICAARAIGFTDLSPQECVDLMDDMKETANFTVVYGLAKTHAFSGRQFLQWLGTEAGRETFWDSFWIDLVLPNPTMTEGWGSDSVARTALAAEGMYPGIDLLVFTDLRFDNEAERIRACGGEIWNVERPGFGGADGHASEKGVSEHLIDRTIVNDGDLAMLEAKVQAALLV